MAEAEGVRHTMCTKFEDMKEKALNEVGGFIHVAKNINGTRCTRKERESLTNSTTSAGTQQSSKQNINKLKAEAPRSLDDQKPSQQVSFPHLL